MHKNMHYKKIIIDIFAVTFREEGVDWNFVGKAIPRLGLVTFREEGVDWNHDVWCHQCWCYESPSARKVWIEMCSVRTFTRYASASPSARKVWIEIGLINCGVCGATSHLPRGRCGLKLECVPLLGVIESHLPRGRCGLKYVSLSRSEELYIVTFREEGVDWNISSNCPLFYFDVTFREEGVDWNHICHCNLWNILCHLPRGRCGLKFIRVCNHIYSRRSPSARKVWIEMAPASGFCPVWYRHLPRGRCGLKSPLRRRIGQILRHLP